MNAKDYPALYQFFGGYVHQDWPEEFGTIEEAVRAYLINEPDDIKQKTQSELSQLIRKIETGESDETILEQLGCYYDPYSDGMTILGWLRLLKEEFRAM